MPILVLPFSFALITLLLSSNALPDSSSFSSASISFFCEARAPETVSPLTILSKSSNLGIISTIFKTLSQTLASIGVFGSFPSTISRRFSACRFIARFIDSWRLDTDDFSNGFFVSDAVMFKDFSDPFIIKFVKFLYN